MVKDSNLRKIVLTGLFIAMTVVFQMFGFHQYVTGPVVNGMLLLSALYTGPFGGVLVGVATPWVAFLRGILPPPLAPMIPFIMLANGAYVLAFYACRRTLGNSPFGSSTGIITGAVIKFLFLSGAVKFLVAVPPLVAKGMQLPQLFTALIGGVLALVVAELLKKAGKKEEF